jgi:hypothetical protein
MTPRKKEFSGKGTGVNFSALTRAKLDLIAAGQDRPLGWVIRHAVGIYVAAYERSADFQQYRQRFPELAKAMDAAMYETGSDKQ